MKVKTDHRSKFSSLSNWKEEAWKKSGLQRDSNPWTPRYRCDALPTELWSHTLGARSIYWVHIFPCSEMMSSLYEIIHICTAVVDESKEWSSHRNRINARALIGQSAVGYCAGKPTEKSRVFWILYKCNRPQVSMGYRLINHLGCW